MAVTLEDIYGNPYLGPSAPAVRGKVTDQYTYVDVTEDGVRWRVFYRAGVEAYRTRLGAAPATGGRQTGGSSSAAAASSSMSYPEAFYNWMGRYPTAAEKTKMENEGWTEDTLRRFAAKNGGRGPLMLEAQDAVRKAAAPFYGGDPSGISTALVNSLVADGYSVEYLTNTYFPSLRGTDATNPLAADFVDLWVNMTGRPLTETAATKLAEMVRSYGYIDIALTAWETWVKTTESAISGNWGAEHRAAIQNTVSSILGRNATPLELSANSSWWNLNDAALYEQLKTTAEYQAIYAGKPAWMSENDYLAEAMSFNAVFRWYYGDSVTVNPDGSLTIPTGEYYQPPSAGTPTTTTVTPAPAAKPEWKSLTTEQFLSDLAALGITSEGTGPLSGRTFADADRTGITYEELINYLPQGTYYKDAQGYHYVQYEGALNPKTGAPATVTKPLEVAPQPEATTTAPGGLNNFGLSYVNPDIISDLINGGYTAEMLQQEFVWQEEAAYLEGVYADILTEAYGGTGGINWYTLASGARGSGAMRAQLVEAQNRVAYRETYRQIFGSDPEPGDYDRISSEFVSPSEMLREYQAVESADEMYEEVNELLVRVYGDGVTRDELKDMALGRENSGELKALVNEATKLDQYTWTHKQYYGSDPTPEDYAKYEGYSGPAELQWEIVTAEKVDEMRPEITEAWAKVYPNEPMITQEQLYTLYGEQQGYGDLRAKVKEALEKFGEAEESEDWAYRGVERLDIGYRSAEQGGFRASAPGLGEL